MEVTSEHHENMGIENDVTLPSRQLTPQRPTIKLSFKLPRFCSRVICLKKATNFDILETIYCILPM